MSFTSWLRNLKAVYGRTQDRSSRVCAPRLRPPSRARLGVEALEGRLVPSTFTVTNILDSGAGSLRAAITSVNQDGNQGIDKIKFAIGSGVQTIVLQSALPALTHRVEIDGTTQPGYAGTPVIELDGENAGATANGLVLAAGHSTVEGLVINRFALDGILLQTEGMDTIQGNYIGTDVTGTTALANGGSGVDIAGVGHNKVGGRKAEDRNLLSGNGNDGVAIAGDSNLVQGNFIGTDATGTSALANGNNGVNIDGSSNTIGGTSAAGARNLISGNFNNDGVLINSGTRNRVQGNYIGTDVTGALALPNINGVEIQSPNNTVGGTTPGARNIISGNSGAGIFVNASRNRVEGNYIGTDAHGTSALHNSDGVVIGSSDITIGGTEPGAGNLLSGNFRSGVYIILGAGNIVQGNYIGTDALGTTPLANGEGAFPGSGGVIVQSSNNLIGGTSPAARNVISGNNGYGLQLIDGVSGNRVEGNFIGTDKTGRKPLGNLAHGVAITFNAPSNNWIGGTADGAGNIIAFNGGAGVAIFPSSNDTSSGAGNAILGNSIFANTGPGIALAPGANNNQAAPVLTSAASSDGQLTIQGTLTSTPNTSFTLEFFSNPAGTSQGKTFLGRITVTTDATGKATFTATFDVETDPGQAITTTATDPQNDTSQFSDGAVVTSAENRDRHQRRR